LWQREIFKFSVTSSALHSFKADRYETTFYPVITLLFLFIFCPKNFREIAKRPLLFALVPTELPEIFWAEDEKK
jgi:hypothetical protein